MPSRFHTMKCAASEDCTTSTAWMRLAYSWPMRWNTRSAPVRSTRTGMPEYLASKARATRSAAGRSSEVYQTTLPSFLAASIKAGVTGLAGGAAAFTAVAAIEVANAPAASAVEPFRMSRLEKSGFFIGFLPFEIRLFASRFVLPALLLVSAAQQPAAVGRHIEPNRGPLRNVLGRRGNHAQLGIVGRRHHIIAARAEKDLPQHRRRNDVVHLFGRADPQPDQMR